MKDSLEKWKDSIVTTETEREAREAVLKLDIVLMKEATDTKRDPPEIDSKGPEDQKDMTGGLAQDPAEAVPKECLNSANQHSIGKVASKVTAVQAEEIRKEKLITIPGKTKNVFPKKTETTEEEERERREVTVASAVQVSLEKEMLTRPVNVSVFLTPVR